MDLEAVWREALISFHLAWTWAKDTVVQHPAMTLLVLVVIYIVWRLLKPGFK